MTLVLHCLEIKTTDEHMPDGRIKRTTTARRAPFHPISEKQYVIRLKTEHGSQDFSYSARQPHNTSPHRLGDFTLPWTVNENEITSSTLYHIGGGTFELRYRVQLEIEPKLKQLVAHIEELIDNSDFYLGEVRHALGIETEPCYEERKFQIEVE